MFYKVLEYFGPQREGWASFIKGHYIKNFSCFDSVDSILCPSKFTPQSQEDWENCVGEDYMIEYITNLDFALKVHKKYPDSRLVGLERGQCPQAQTFKGYDILDGYSDISLITNWGPHDKDHALKNFDIQDNGLISNYKIAEDAVQKLTSEHGFDAHVKDCQIWAVHNLGF